MILTNKRKFPKLFLAYQAILALCPHLALPCNDSKLLSAAKRFCSRHTREYVVNFYLSVWSRV